MPGNPRLHVRVSEPNLRKLRRISGDHGVHMGALVDDALNLYFTPRKTGRMRQYLAD